jgi:DNA-binding transcriptional ArsR family regulator
MTYEPEERLYNSKLALKILKTLTKEDKYVKEIAEDVDSTVDSVNGYLKMLRDTGMIKRSKRTQRQYYKINYEGITEFCYSHISDDAEADKRLEELEENKAKRFIEKYVRNRISEVVDMKINEFLFEQMRCDLNTTIMKHPDLEEERPDLRHLSDAISLYLNEGKGENLENLQILN